MLLQEITLFALVSIPKFLPSAANANHGYIGFTSQHNRKNDRHGRLIHFRPIRNYHHFQDEQTLIYNTHSQTGGRVPYQNHQDVNRFSSQNDHNRWNRIPFNAGPESNRQFDRRHGYGYLSNYDSQRKQNFHHDREESIADYVKRYNFHNNPHSTFYNGPNDSNFNPPIEEDIIIEDEPEDYKHLTHNFQTNSGHKDLTEATFPQNRPSHGTSNFPNKHRFSPENGPLHEEHKHFYYEKPDFDISDDSLDNKGIDPELVEIYKKIIEVYKKKQKQKNGQGKTPFYFGNQEKHNVKTSFFLQQNNPLGHNAGKNYFTVPDDGSKSNILMPRHPNIKGFVFPGPVQSNKPVNPYTPFQASPQFHRYSEPDPLYHPKSNPFQLHDTSHTLPAPATVPQVTTTSSTTAGSDSPQQQSTTEENKNFPDSINAQLPPPEKDVDTSIPYVAATVVTPKTTSETTITIHSQTLPLTQSISESPTMTSSPPTLYRNETFPLQEKLTQEANIATRAEQQIELYNENLTPDNTTLSVTTPATGQPELFFLPTAAEEISGSSSKESPTFQKIVIDGLHKPTTYRRNFTLTATTVLSPLAISTLSATAIQNNVYKSPHTISTSNNAKNKEEAHDISVYNVNTGNEINIGEKDIGVLQLQGIESKNEKHTNNNNNVPLSPSQIDIHNIDVLSTPESATITQNITALNVTSANIEYWAPRFTAKNEEGSETSPKSNTEKSPENSERNFYANENQIISTDKNGHNYSTKSNDTRKQYTTSNKILVTHESEKNIHYLMSIINQARTHVILSQNSTQGEGASLN